MTPSSSNSLLLLALLSTVFRDSALASLSSPPKREKMDTIPKVRQFFWDAHKNQKRWGGEPYGTHLDAVAMRVDQKFEKNLPAHLTQPSSPASPDIKFAVLAGAFGHDYLEDKEFTSGTVNKLRDAGFPSLSIQIIEHLTKRRSETYANYIVRLVEIPGPIGVYTRFVKLQDLDHNLSDLKPGSKRNQYELAQVILNASPL